MRPIGITIAFLAAALMLQTLTNQPQFASVPSEFAALPSQQPAEVDQQIAVDPPEPLPPIKEEVKQEAQPIMVERIVYEKVCDGVSCRLVPRVVRTAAKVAVAVPKAIVQSVQSVRACPTCPQNASVSYTPVNSGRNWYYRGPGSLAAHVEREHGVDCSGLSQAEVQAIHNAAHEGMATVSHRLAVQPVRSFVRAQPVRGLVRGIGCALFPRRCN